jgi:ubiquinone/menaquinone biosynthesis C-methylase UbiE
MQLTPVEGYRAWAPCYDQTANPLLSLESRVLSQFLAVFSGTRILDVGCGTGRWMEPLLAGGKCVFGVDLSIEMLGVAAAKPALTGRFAVADIEHLPLQTDSFDLALCCFTLSYAPHLTRALAELARVARRVAVTDLHPEAMQRGWRRSFHQKGRTIEISHTSHSIRELDEAAVSAGLTRPSRLEVAFGKQERSIFRAAGKEHAFAEMSECPAILFTTWAK